MFIISFSVKATLKFPKSNNSGLQMNETNVLKKILMTLCMTKCVNKL